MNDFNMAESATRGASDISGVKDASYTRPEGEIESVSRVADGVENTKTEAAGAIENEKQGESVQGNGDIEAEFDALIHGRFSEVYKKRTESIIRKRLRSAKAHNEAGGSQKSVEATEPVTVPDAPEVEKQVALPDTKDIDKVRNLNKSRPIENGLAGSCGIVTKINVSALDSEGVLSIIKRVGTGEKISFK